MDHSIPADSNSENSSKHDEPPAHQFTIREHDSEVKINAGKNDRKDPYQGMKVFIIHQVEEAH